MRYNVHRSTTPGFTPSTGNRIAQPTGTSYTDTGVSPGTYYYRVTAEDAAGNIGPPSNEASATVTADTTPPTAPSGLTAPVSGQHREPDLDRVDRQRRRPPLQRPPRDDGRLHAERGEPDRAAHRHDATADSGLAAGSYFYKVVAEDAAGNLSGASNEATAVIGADGTPPTAPSGLTAGVSGSTVSLSWTAATDNIGGHAVQRPPVDHLGVHAERRQPDRPADGTSYSDAGRPPGTYYYKVTAEDAAGNVGPASNQATATVQAPSTGLVAAYGFDEGAGTTTADRSGNGNTGTLSNATWSTAGKFGNALFFNGTSARVNVADSNSLDLTSAMTLEAWVRPSITNASYRTVVLKEQTSNLAYSLYSTTDTNRPDTEAVIGGAFEVVTAPSRAPRRNLVAPGGHV